jgi:hypothetical protein
VLNQQTGAGAVWWTAATTDYVGGQILASPVTYRVSSVKIHGAEVLVPGQTIWTPQVGGAWTIQVALYGMTVKTRDAVFGTPVSGQLQLTYPDGFVTTQAVGSDGTATFANLPGGKYSVKMDHALLAPATTVVLTKLQSASLRVVTMADVGLTVGVALAVLAVLALVVWWLLSRLRTRRRLARRAMNGPAA